MQIGTSYITSGYFGLTSGTGASASGSTSADSSSFGPAALVSVGQGAGTVLSVGGYAVTGFPSIVTGNATLWQFDLTSVFGAASQEVIEQFGSEEDQKAAAARVKEAQDLIAAEEYDQAREILNVLLEENRTNSAAIHTLGTIEFEQGRYADAEQYFLRAHVMNPTVGYDIDATNARILQGDDDAVYERARAMLTSQQNREAATRLLVTLTQRNEAHVPGHVLLGETLLDDGDPMNGLLQLNAAIYHAQPGELGLVEGHVQALVERAPDGAFVRQLLGKIQLKEERYDEALVTLKLALDLSDNQPSYFKDIALAHVGVGRQALGRGDVTAAMEAFSRAKEIDGGEYEVKLALAEGYLARAERFNKWGNVSDAVQDYRFAADILTDLPGTSELREQAAYDVYRIGRRLEEKRIAAGEEIDGEVTAFQIAYDLNEESKTYRSKLAETRVALGDQYVAAGELEQAAYSYSKAHKLYEYNDDYKDKMIAAFEAWGDERLANYDYDDAIEAFLQAYTADPKNDAVKSKLAFTYNERGLDHQFWERYKQAADDFEEAYHLFPDNTEYKTNYYAMASYDDD